MREPRPPRLASATRTGAWWSRWWTTAMARIRRARFRTAPAMVLAACARERRRSAAGWKLGPIQREGSGSERHSPCLMPDTAEAVIRVLLADDQALVRAGFRVLLESAPDIRVSGEAANGEEAVAMARKTRPDVVLMDIRMPVLDGIGATRRIVGDVELDATRVLILTTFEVDEYVFEALRSGASGFVVKDIEPTELLDAIRVVAGGEALLSPSVTRRLIEEFARQPAPPSPDAPGVCGLTKRERDVMGLVATGRSNLEIAADLFISPATAKTHVSRIMSKLDVRDRAQLVVMAYETGLVSPGTRGQ